MGENINRKRFVFLFIVLLFTYLLFLIISSFVRKDFIIVNDVNGIFVYRNNSWNYIKNYYKFVSKKYDIYSGENYLGKYYLGYSRGLYLYDKDKNNVNSDYEIFAVSNKSKINVISFGLDYRDVTDDLYIKEYINSKGIIVNSNSYLYSSFDYDLDNDGKMEKIVSLSNHIDLNSTNFISAVFVVDDGNFYDIKYNSASEISKLEILIVNKIIDVFNDNKIEFIIDKSYYSKPYMHCEDLYQYHNKISKRYSTCEY